MVRRDAPYKLTSLKMHRVNLGHPHTTAKHDNLGELRMPGGFGNTFKTPAGNMSLTSR